MTTVHPHADTEDAFAMTTTIPNDSERLRATVDFVREQDTAALLSLLLPGLDAPELQALADRCRFSHAALLVFPPQEAALRTDLAACGLAADTAARPSVVVRDRLAVRHLRDAAALDVHILRPQVPGPRGERRTVEVFALTVPPGSDLAGIAAHERTRRHEEHLAFEVDHPDPLILAGLRAILVRHGALPDGGGYNPHEDGTVLYFTAPADSKAGYRRLELYAPGDHSNVLAAHLDEQDGNGSAETLLRLLTADTGTTADALAQSVGAEPESLARLLRYLAMLDVVAEHHDGFRLTELGILLRTGTPGSLRALALMYGGPFYESFASLGHTVRTGEVGFEHRFGENHFDYFARHPDLAELFDQSMAASSRMFEPITAHPAVTAAGRTPAVRAAVDIAGGNGELLGRLLAAQPRLRGILLERPHVLEAARRSLDAAGLGERCTYLPGDFADVPEGGDVYLLSRVLHDWDDDRCREILRGIAHAMPADADLLIVERVLPADGSASLATAWDLHMMCNVGGRERRTDHYARLLADAGLALVDHSSLPLEGRVLHARKASA
jgi:hypothetical protein